MRRQGRIGTPLMAVVISVGTSTALASYTFEPLGSLTSDFNRFTSAATGVSGDGSTVVGGSSSDAGPDSVPSTEAFRRVAGGGMLGLGDLPGIPEEVLGTSSIAHDVSNSGSVVVGYGRNIGSGGNREAFRWTGGNMVGLGDLPGGIFFSEAFGVSGDGSTVVGYSNSQVSGISGSPFQAFRWTAAGGMEGLGDLPFGAYQSIARSVSDDGSVVVGEGRSQASGSNNEAFLWTAGGGMVGLGGLIPGAGAAVSSEALGVSSDGSVIVGRAVSTNGIEAFRWTADGGMVGLGDLPGHDFFSEATDVSADGSVVVGKTRSTNGSSIDGSEAFIWDSESGIRSVREILIENGVDLTGWTLSTASGISANGNVLVGSGKNPAGKFEGWRASFTGEGDFGGDGDVDGEDLMAWQRNRSIGSLSSWRFSFGRRYSFFSRFFGRSANVSVPEPSSLCLLAGACLLAGTCRKRHPIAEFDG